MKTAVAAFKKHLDQAKSAIGFAAGSVFLDFTEQVARRMKFLGINRANLAKRIGASPAYISKMLCNDTNLTLESMVKIAHALETDVVVSLCPKQTASEWFLKGDAVVYVDNSSISTRFSLPEITPYSELVSANSQYRRKFSSAVRS